MDKARVAAFLVIVVVAGVVLGPALGVSAAFLLGVAGWGGVDLVMKRRRKAEAAPEGEA